MSPHPTSSAWEPIRRLDVTPFINVVFVLLVIALVTTPAMTGGYLVLPGARNAVVIDTVDISVTVDDGGRLMLATADAFLVVPAADLPRHLHEAFAGRAADDRVLYLRADHGTPYLDVLPVLGAARTMGVRRLGLVTTGSD